MNEAEFGNYGIWKCAWCALEKPATAHQKRQQFCSTKCYGANKSQNWVGEKNPSFKNASQKTCLHCHGNFSSYNKGRKFCTLKCYSNFCESKKLPAISKEKRSKNKKICVTCNESFDCSAASHKINCSIECATVWRNNKLRHKNCAICGNQFRVFPSSTKRYCSYECHLDSGGAFKAGMAAAKAIMKYGPKKDANHNELFDVLKKYCAVYDVSASGMGIPDGLAWVNNAWHLFDVKNPKTGYGKRGLNPVQKKWLSQAQGGPIYLLYTVEDAENFGCGRFEGLKFEVPDSD